jgi:hypothetical protein
MQDLLWMAPCQIPGVHQHVTACLSGEVAGVQECATRLPTHKGLTLRGHGLASNFDRGSLCPNATALINR